MENSIFVIRRFSFVQFLIGRWNGFFNLILQRLLNVAEKLFFIFVSNGRDHRELNTVVARNRLGWQPKSPRLSEETSAEVSREAQIIRIGVETIFIIEKKGSLQHFDVRNIFPIKKHSVEHQSSKEKRKNKRIKSQ